MTRPKIWNPTTAELSYLARYHEGRTAQELSAMLSLRFDKDIRDKSISYQLKQLGLEEFVKVEPIKRPSGLYNEVLCRRWG